MSILKVNFEGKNYIGWTVSDLEEAGVPVDVINSALDEEKKSLRQSAYKAESDPLYMEWQFDQTAESEQAWRDKVAEIKLRYPLTVPT